MTGNSVPMGEVTCDDGQIASPTAEKKSQPLSRWKGFRLTEGEFRRLKVYAALQGESTSEVLRALVQQAVRDVE